MPVLLHDVLTEAATAWPERPAVSAAGLTATYAELHQRSQAIAAGLCRLGVRRGDRVVVAVGSHLHLLPALLFAVGRTGAVFCVLHEQVRGVPFEHVLTDSEARLVVTDDPDVLAGAGAAAQSWQELLADDAAPGPPDGPTPLAIDPACMIYTSGTTALPKAVVSTHQQMVFAVGAIHSVLGLRHDDVIFCVLPLSFDYGLYQVFLACVSGAHLVLAGAGAAGPALLSQLVRHQATVLPAVPSLAQSLAWLARRAQRTLPLRLLTNTGAALSTETVKALRAALPELRVHLMYGLTECKRATIMPAGGDLERPGSCGRALPGTEVIIVGADGRPLPPGEIGEIVVRGPHVMAGYWRRPELTAERFPRREGLFPELCTGDYGYLDAEGYLYFNGRRDDIYKERGFRVSATEVEAAAMRTSMVQAAAVLPPADGRPSVLFVVSNAESHEVLSAMRAVIEPSKVPSMCEVLSDLPLTANGKVDRAALCRLAGGLRG